MPRRSRGWGILLLLGVMASCGRNPATVRDLHLTQGDAHYRDGRFPQATVEYQKAVTADPNSSDARQRLAESYVRVGMVDFAVKEYANAARLAPNHADLQIQTATLLLAAGRYEEAETFARKGVELAPTNGAAHMFLGNALAGLSSVTEGTAVVALDPASPGAAARFREAELAYGKAIALEPNAPLPHVALGRLQEVLGKRGDAEASYKRAIVLKASDVAGHRALARLYLAERRQKEAEGALRALAEALGTPAGYLNLADYYIGLGRLADARPLLESLLNRVTTFASARLRLAALEFEAGHLPRAHELTDEVLEQLPNDPKASLLKARLLRSEGRIDDAIIHARNAVDTDRESIVARSELASLYVDRHDLDEAIRVLADTRTSVKDNAGILADLAGLYLDRRDAVRARTVAQRALTAAPDLVAARAIVTRSFIQAGDITQAAAAFEAIPAPARGSAAVLVAQGDLEAARRAPATARRAYEQALSLEPANREALAGLIALDVASRQFAAGLADLSKHAKQTSPADRSLAGRLRALVVSAQGNRSGAEKALRELVSGDPADAETWLALAYLLREDSRLADASAAAAEAVRHQPAWPQATLTLGELLEKQGKPTEARTRYEQLLKVDPEAADVRARIAR